LLAGQIRAQVESCRDLITSRISALQLETALAAFACVLFASILFLDVVRSLLNTESFCQDSSTSGAEIKILKQRLRCLLKASVGNKIIHRWIMGLLTNVEQLVKPQ
jgi:hypothetical protein